MYNLTSDLFDLELELFYNKRSRLVQTCAVGLLGALLAESGVATARVSVLGDAHHTSARAITHSR